MHVLFEVAHECEAAWCRCFSSVQLAPVRDGTVTVHTGHCGLSDTAIRRLSVVFVTPYPQIQSVDCELKSEHYCKHANETVFEYINCAVNAASKAAVCLIEQPCV